MQLRDQRRVCRGGGDEPPVLKAAEHWFAGVGAFGSYLENFAPPRGLINHRLFDGRRNIGCSLTPGISVKRSDGMLKIHDRVALGAR